MIRIIVTTDLKLDGYQITPQMFKLAVQSGLALMKRRIVTEGKTADGTPLKPYSTKPTYISTKGVGTGTPRIKPKGGRKTKTGKSRFFAGGYAEFKQLAGRGTKVNLTASGNLIAKKLRVLRAPDYKVEMGWAAKSQHGRRTPLGTIAHGLDARDGGRVFVFSDNEANAIVQALADMLDE